MLSTTTTTTITTPIIIAFSMSGRIGQVNRIISDVTVTVPGLRILRIRNDGIGLDESANRGVIESCLIVHQPGLIQLALTRISEIGLGDGLRAGQRPQAAKGQVTLLAEQCPAGIRDCHGRALVIAQEVF